MVEKLVDVQQTVAQADFKRCPTFQFRRIETLVGISSREQRRGYTGKPVSDRGTLGDVSQSPQSSFKRCRKLLILSGEMLERSIRHAWKAKRASDINPPRSVSTHTRSLT